jgi:hypothetical protein
MNIEAEGPPPKKRSRPDQRATQEPDNADNKKNYPITILQDRRIFNDSACVFPRRTLVSAGRVILNPLPNQWLSQPVLTEPFTRYPGRNNQSLLRLLLVTIGASSNPPRHSRTGQFVLPRHFGTSDYHPLFLLPRHFGTGKFVLPRHTGTSHISSLLQGEARSKQRGADAPLQKRKSRVNYRVLPTPICIPPLVRKRSPLGGIICAKAPALSPSGARGAYHPRRSAGRDGRDGGEV